MELTEEELNDKVHSAIQTVDGDDSWRIVDTFWVDRYINVGFSIDDASDGDNGLSMQVEVIEPQELIEPESVVEGYQMREINEYFFELDRLLRNAIEAATGEPPVDELTYLGLAPSGYGNRSAVFDATVRRAE